MGVPSFYRWLIERYPLILQDVIEEEPLDVKVPVDTIKPNPSCVEYDNLYLDMKIIIHPCSPTTFSEVFQCMFYYIDRLFVMVRPQKLLFLAIDGVAPRAKMNQQRSRRFRAAKDAAEAASEKERLRQEFESEGRRLPPKLDSQVFDSNVMNSWNGVHVYSFICVAILHSRFDHDFLLLKVIPSDANVPGEGEHKIMSYIRLQKNHPGYNPNTCHFLYGLDADLIMLALATHEVHISILREVVFTPAQQDKCFLCGQLGTGQQIVRARYRARQETCLIKLRQMLWLRSHTRVLYNYLCPCTRRNLDQVQVTQVMEASSSTLNSGVLSGCAPEKNATSSLRPDRSQDASQVTHPSTTPAQARLTLEFFQDTLRKRYCDICYRGNRKGLVVTELNRAEIVRLGVQGWRERYYEEKFIAKTIEEMEQICRDVVSFLMPVYPYHYAPFASDLKFLDKLDIKFELGSTFKQFNQLLAVLPSASAHALPECFRKLMTDPSSPIAELYPPDFEIDMNGKRYSWQGIAKLPFIEEQRLLDAAAKLEHSLTLIRSLSSRTIKLSNKERATVKEKIDHGLSIHASAPPSRGMEDVLANQVICAIYKLPDDLRGSDIARPPPGVVLPKKTVQLADLKGGANQWHEDGLGKQRTDPNTIFHNNQVSRKVPSLRGSAVQRKHPQSELALKKNRSHQSELTEEEKTSIRKRKEKEKRGRNMANRRDRAKNEQQANKGESNLENKRPRSEVNEENRLEHKSPRFTEERNINTEGKEQNTCAQSELTEKNATKA
uniref:5'-3' exoribonuclease n=1 Tax=Brassica oleracea var. oleracea TaxID=109376 RepID=A0A0D3BUP9_BRAOL